MRLARRAESGFASHSSERAVPRSKTEVMRRTPALVRLERKLAEDPCALLTAAEIRVVGCRANRELATRIGLLDGGRTRPRHRS